MLAFEVEYLLGRVFAGDFRDRSEPEWPPHPARLFSALAAACHETRMGDSVRDALLWLEKLGAPSICASPGSQHEKVMSFVPTNYPGKKGNTLPDTRGKQPRFFPRQTPARSTVYFVWPHAKPAPDPERARTGRTSRWVSRQSSFVRADALTDAPPDPNYIPDSEGAE